MYFAGDVGTPIFKAAEAPGDTAQLLWKAGILFLVIFVIFMTILLLLRRRLLKKENKR